MNILIPNSWLKDYLKTNATATQFAAAMSLASVSIERVEKVDDDYVFDIEVTTNRPDLMSIQGIAKEAAAVLPLAGYSAVYVGKKTVTGLEVVHQSSLLNIQNDPELVNRILAVVLEVNLKPSPKLISDRLEKTGIRSINSVVDVTNYIMREIGHPSHVFDYDRLKDHTLIIRKSKKGERIVTLDEKEHTLPGNDIVADNGQGEIIDLLGIMGTANSVVTDNTKRVVLFLDNNNTSLLRNTSMNLGIRTEAAVLNEKGVDPELMMPTLLRGVELLEMNADAKVISPVIDIYPNKPKEKRVVIDIQTISRLIGIEIEKKTILSILKALGFAVDDKGDTLMLTVPSARLNDIEIEEDIVEEIARIYGYHKIPNSLPSSPSQAFYHQDRNEFYWTQKVKEAFKYWGFAETYTYSLVPEELFDGPIESAVKIKNPLTEDKAYMRQSLLPSLFEVAQQNKIREKIMLFEISNIYKKKADGLPEEIQHLAFLIKDRKKDFFYAKGITEVLFSILGVGKPEFEQREESTKGANIILKGKSIGYIEDEDEVTLELDFSYLLTKASSSKKYLPPPKFPPIIEDVRVEIPSHYNFSKIKAEICNVDELVFDASLLDVYQNKKTFRIIFQDQRKNLTNEEIAPIRKKILSLLESKFKAKIG